MYLKKIHIQNYGCIENLEINSRFDQDGNPLPIVLIGENGSGKTLALANIVDAIVQIKRNIFGNSIREVAENKYFKVGTQGYIRSGNTCSRVHVEFEHGDKVLHYYDIMSSDPRVDFDSQKVVASELVNIEDFKENGFSRKTVSNLTKKECDSSLLLYFPADRYYLPLWYNQANYNKISYVSDTDIHSSKLNLIKNDLLSNIKDWLTDIYLERISQVYHLPNEGNIPAELRGRRIDLPVPTDIQNLISRIFGIIKGKQIAFNSQTNRKNKVVGLAGNYDISQLSEGEMSLFSIAISIVKEWDLSHDLVDINQIAGMVIIDEADLGLHIDYAYRALPQLMKLFPKVQFILTAHSPFLLAGLINTFQENVDVISMPKGNRIFDIKNYCELQKVIDIMDKFQLHKEIDNKEIEEARALLQKQISESNKIHIYTEGITDGMYLDAYLKNKPYYSRIEINPNLGDKDYGDSNLDSRYKMLQTIGGNNIKICMFDRDNPSYIVSQEYEHGSNRTYRFSIPTPSHRSPTDKVAIEHYFKDDEIKTADEKGHRLFMVNEFGQDGTTSDDIYYSAYPVRVGFKNPLHILDGRDTNSIVTLRKGVDNVALPKKKFAEYVTTHKNGFDFEMSEFHLISDVIEKIIAEENVGEN